MFHHRFHLVPLVTLTATLISLSACTSEPIAEESDALTGPAGVPGVVQKKGLALDLRSSGRIRAEAMVSAAVSGGASGAPAQSVAPQVQLRGGNLQVNDPALDRIQTFPGFLPFLTVTESETQIAARGQNLVVAYNSSAGASIVQIGPDLFFEHEFLSAFSTSNDGGRTWTSGFVPPVPGSIFTLGDPVVGVDRTGKFYYSGMGLDASFKLTLQVNRSEDGGRTWSDAVVVQQDDGGDKPWMAIGRDPAHPAQDNVYVTWTSFQTTGEQLRFGRSIDGGATFTSKTIFAPGPDPDPTHPQNHLQFSNPYVDPFTGYLYVPFLRLSNTDGDFIQIMVSEDAGETFSFLHFKVPGALDPTLLPVVPSGHIIDCGDGGGLRLAIHDGPEIPGRFGLPSYVDATRLVTQPAFAARNGVLYLAFSRSTSPIFGDPTSGSDVVFLRSDDGGTTWSPPTPVNPAVAADEQHVLPSLALDADPQDVHVAYYTQHADGTVDVDLANSHDRGATFAANRTKRVTSSAFRLPPTNVPLAPPSGNSYPTVNFDLLIVSCYALGEYMGVTAANGTVYTAWGDTRNLVTEPADALEPLSGQTHPQADVFFQAVKAQ